MSLMERKFSGTQQWRAIGMLLLGWTLCAGTVYGREADDNVKNDSTENLTYPIPVLPPNPVTHNDPPTDDEVLRALSEIDGTGTGIPALRDQLPRDAIRITKELLADYIDPPRIFPLVGPMQVHHLRWKCCVSVDARAVGVPNPAANNTKVAEEVIYIDHTHLYALPKDDDEESTTKATNADAVTRDVAAADSALSSESASKATGKAVEVSVGRKQGRLRWRLRRQR